nr:hypothetical protein [uncultured Blautia sp.]
MSKINTVRLINLNYNNNAIRISDECFHFNGESTLISLRNGGGKSVLVQMLTAPFVHKRYRDAKDRTFESYFTTSRPSFILLEWALDQEAGYVLAGLMIRRSQENTGDTEDNLDMISIISEYKQPCLQDIYHLPVVEKGEKEMTLKSFHACKQMFEEFKKNGNRKFFCYDMTSFPQARQYFDKLMEYNINYKEWETIIKRVNQKESGLSELFADCKDEKGLVEKWFLEAVESKLNKEHSRIREFQSILEKYAGQYKENRAKIQRRDHIRIFKEEGEKIRSQAENLLQVKQEKQDSENRIAWFIHDLEKLREETKRKSQDTWRAAEQLELEAAQVEYEDLSSQVYTQKDQELFHESNRDMIDIERDKLREEEAVSREKRNLLYCAKQQQVVQEEKEELDAIREKILIARRKEEDWEPEQKSLGYRLKCGYEKLIRENEERQEGIHEQHEKTLSQIALEEKKQEEAGEKLLKINGQIGSLESLIRTYDKDEEAYNIRHQDNLSRNILGVYEPEALESRQESIRASLEQAVETRKEIVDNLTGNGEEVKQKEQLLEEEKEQLFQKKTEIVRATELLGEYENELESRRVILKYLDLNEDMLYEKVRILHASQRKLEELSRLRRNLEKEEDSLLKELHGLTGGRTLELPKDMEEEFRNLGISIVYGMEWLKKNGFTKEQNQELVQKNPFLPYSLILTEKEIHLLEGQGKQIYTSFPVPVIQKEKLQEINLASDHRVLSFEGMGFYVFFNENLLDEEKLQQMILEKQQQLARIREQIDLRKKEYEESFVRQTRLENQNVTKENWQALQEKKEKLEAEKTDLENEILEKSTQIQELKNQAEQLQKQTLEAERGVDRQEQQKEELEGLCRSYQSYEDNRTCLENVRAEEKILQEMQTASREKIQSLQELRRSLELDGDKLLRDGEELHTKYRKYQTYESTESTLNAEMESEQKELPLSQLEARYDALTSEFSRELKELEEQEQTCMKRFQRAEEELVHLQEKYHLEENSWKEVIYSRKEEMHQESVLEDCRRKLEEKNRSWTEEDKQAAICHSRVLELMKQIHTLCKQEEPAPRTQIRSRDFEGRKEQIRVQIQTEKDKGKQLEERLRSYEENLTALSEYQSLPRGERGSWQEDPGRMEAAQLRTLKGVLLQEYSRTGRELQKCREELVQTLNNILRMEEFQEEFYRRPLEKMLEIADDGDKVLLQLEATIQSYDNLMEKLEVDISVIEKEKERIVELLEQYVEDIHRNLGKIDGNSTITIREKPVKMLKIQLPSWEDNRSLYHIRMEDFVDTVTVKAIEVMDKNENVQEFFGAKVTTRNLYDQVVGVGNVQIRLYKIEENREYPITWKEVSRNSGGEGFLSAFVILSSLLYYMRKGENDLLTDQNQGKVLLMDNPFAQTNASHLLKPLMDMARKTNTQLICLTGLGGESIYNRFDNIYVLNLIAASLRGDTQYLRAEHHTGEEPDTILPSRIQVSQDPQMSLLF